MNEGGRDRKAPRRNAGRGVAYWTDGNEERIFVITTGFYLVALDAKTGIPVKRFGVDGAVDLMKGAERRLRPMSRASATARPRWSIATRSSCRPRSRKVSRRTR